MLSFQLLFIPSHKYFLIFNPLFSPLRLQGARKSVSWGALIKRSTHLKDFHSSCPLLFPWHGWREEWTQGIKLKHCCNETCYLQESSTTSGARQDKFNTAPVPLSDLLQAHFSFWQLPTLRGHQALPGPPTFHSNAHSNVISSVKDVTSDPNMESIPSGIPLSIFSNICLFYCLAISSVCVLHQWWDLTGRATPAPQAACCT